MLSCMRENSSATYKICEGLRISDIDDFICKNAHSAHKNRSPSLTHGFEWSAWLEAMGGMGKQAIQGRDRKRDQRQSTRNLGSVELQADG